MLIEFKSGHETVDFDQLAALMTAVGWGDRAQDPARLRLAIEGSCWVVTAWCSTELVGFCRAISDAAFTAYVNNVVVRPACQRQGIGRELVRRLMEGRSEITFILHAPERVQPFYRGLGFDPAPDMLRRLRATPLQ